ncbi:cilia- and flagella-associated protein 161-like isoform X2 [Tamandua tetradactyla]|uniref:cilia- and flagella-associated protein 161-like isoform X2 n=1 Tax=Tamandua tetradactyla TaxID=48850 RepID=UPI004053ED63
MAQNLYGPRVRMGNWNEDLYLEEECVKDFLEKRDKGELLIQRNHRLKENFLRQMQLSISEDGYLHYGNSILLVNPDHPDRDTDLFLNGDLSLCMTPEDITARLSDEVEVPCGLSAVQTNIPIGRNTFIILSVDGNAIGQVLQYGQNFCLGIQERFADKMGAYFLSNQHGQSLTHAMEEQRPHASCQMRLDSLGGLVLGMDHALLSH